VTSYDLILDIGGNTPISRLRRVLSPTGTLVISGGETSGRFLGGADRQLRAIAVSPFLKQRLTTFVAKPNAAAFERLTTLVEDGHLVPAIERTFALSEVPTAMRHLESGRTRGKLVITI
jgi:NADPH:quinone reductase-like Zn-dependent oxidoreductase